MRKRERVLLCVREGEMTGKGKRERERRRKGERLCTCEIEGGRQRERERVRERVRRGGGEMRRTEGCEEEEELVRRRVHGTCITIAFSTTSPVPRHN